MATRSSRLTKHARQRGRPARGEAARRARARRLGRAQESARRPRRGRTRRPLSDSAVRTAKTRMLGLARNAGAGGVRGTDDHAPLAAKPAEITGSRGSELPARNDLKSSARSAGPRRREHTETRRGQHLATSTARTNGLNPGREATWQQGEPDFVGPEFPAAWSGSPEEAASAELVRKYNESLRKRLWGD
jgi:hypothetical protein